ncbi:MAG: rhodanese-like domain-containing protein [Bacteroidota bacterium]|nr:rhodanese-like domain-containing protein [Bacteroidota bacterium]
MNFFKKLFGSAPSVNFKELTQKGAVIIDVRTPGEFGSGHIKSSVNIPLNNIGNQINKIKKYNKPIITVCQSGSRSRMATGILKRAGVEAYNGGAWSMFSRKIS